MATRGPTRGFFDAWSRIYDFPLVQAATYKPVHDAVLRALAAEPCRRILDVGCGTGRLAERLLELRGVAAVVGCDFSAGMLGEAAERLQSRATARVELPAAARVELPATARVESPPTAHLVRGDATRLPFRDGCCDAVVSTEAFHWFPDQNGALREIHRVLRPGGRLLLALVSPPFEVIADAFEVGMRLVGQPLQWTTPRRLGAQVAAAGFRVESQRRIFRLPGFLLPPTLAVARRSS